MKKIRGCGSLKFEDLGQGGQRYALSGLSLTMITSKWWWYGKVVNHWQWMTRGGGGMVNLVVVSIIVNASLEGAYSRACSLYFKKMLV